MTSVFLMEKILLCYVGVLGGGVINSGHENAVFLCPAPRPAQTFRLLLVSKPCPTPSFQLARSWFQTTAFKQYGGFITSHDQQLKALAVIKVG